jgi:soluble lytic murein transglycosylase-like protein
VPYAQLFNSAGSKYGVSPTLLAAVAKQESGYRADAVSPAGAQGMMQLMPGTAKSLGVQNSFNPTQAVDGAARMLRDLTTRFGSTSLALAAYNAGPGAVLKYDGVPPYPETQRYVRNVLAIQEAM